VVFGITAVMDVYPSNLKSIYAILGAFTNPIKIVRGFD
jgi:hypothetical protein